MSTATPLLLPRSGGPHLLDDGTLARSELITPGMCGPNSLFVGCLGDWTWDAVSQACSVNAYDARDATGAPAYLSFCSFRIRGSRRINPLSLTFGDRLQIASKVFGQGSESVFTLHRIRHDDGRDAMPLHAADFYATTDEDCLYVEVFNRWISRTRPDSNRDLVRNAPVGFQYRQLPPLQPEYSPRPAFARARDGGGFEPDPGPARAVTDTFHTEYRVEPSRDLNGVGLLYFASYFSIIDWALLRLWRELGRSDRAFLRRLVLDQRVAYLGNADADAVLDVALTRRPAVADPADEIVDIVVAEKAPPDPAGPSGDRVLAVAALRLHGEQEVRP
ncbi:MAG: biosynthesis cluster domain-containing protein [Catenulispora sp.]|nr:biosynthesis cluster domain-containing protein [Catenulispora sp.]